MSRGWSTFLLWGSFLVVLTLVSVGFGARFYTWGQLLVSAVFTLALGAFVLFLTRREGDAPRRATRIAPDLSFPPILLALGIAAALLGAEVGLWLSLIGGGLCVLATGGLIREWRAQRDTARGA